MAQRFLPTANTKFLYRFDTGALTTDSSGNGNDLTAIGDPAETTGQFSGAVDLDLNDAYSRADDADFKPTTAFSVGAWYTQADTDADYHHISQCWSANPNISGWMLTMANGKAEFYSGKNTGAVAGTDYQGIFASTSTADSSFHMTVAVWDGSYLRIYTDGVADATPVAWANAPVYGTVYIRVGCQSNDGSNINFWTDVLDDCFLENRAMSAGEIYTLYNRSIKTFNGLALESVKTINGLETYLVKSRNGLT